MPGLPSLPARRCLEPLTIVTGLGVGGRDYQLEVENLNAKLGQRLKRLEEK